MSACLYCGKKASWFSAAHERCESLHGSMLRIIEMEVKEAVEAGNTYDSVAEQINTKAKVAYVRPDELREAIKRGWSEGAEACALKGRIDRDEMDRLIAFNDGAGISWSEVTHSKGFNAAVFSFRLWALRHRMRVVDTATDGFNVLQGEAPFAAFDPVQYCQEVAAHSTRGGYSGISMPVGNGMRYNLGGYRSHVEEHISLTALDTGKLLLTTKNIYFAGQHRSMRIPYSSIVSFKPYADAVGFFRNQGPLEILVVVKAQPYVGGFLIAACEYLCTPEAQLLYSEPRRS